MKKLLFGLILICLIANDSAGGQLEDSFKLKEMCSNKAKEQASGVNSFFRENLNGPDIKHYYYMPVSNHFNKQLNTCLTLDKSYTAALSLNEHNEMVFAGKLSDVYETEVEYFIQDVIEHKILAKMTVIALDTTGLGIITVSNESQLIKECQVLGKKCNSKLEWEKFIKPLMEE